MSNGREPQVIDTFLTLTDTLVGDFDALDMLTMLAERCVELLDVSAAGVVLTDGDGGGLSVAAASSERTRLLEVFAVAIDAGPCVDCVRTGQPVISDDLTSVGAQQRWPRFAQGAEDAGFRSAHALPMRLHGKVIGVVNLLHTDRHTLTEADARLGQALADAATIGLLHERTVRHAETVSEQLQSALNSGVIIEQAKGVLATQTDISPEDAFAILRSQARSHGQRLTELARGRAHRRPDQHRPACPVAPDVGYIVLDLRWRARHPAAIPHLIDEGTGGAVILISSRAGFKGCPRPRRAAAG